MRLAPSADYGAARSEEGRRPDYKIMAYGYARSQTKEPVARRPAL
jgi:hypothetical protein